MTRLRQIRLTFGERLAVACMHPGEEQARTIEPRRLGAKFFAFSVDAFPHSLELLGKRRFVVALLFNGP